MIHTFTIHIDNHTDAACIEDLLNEHSIKFVETSAMELPDTAEITSSFRPWKKGQRSPRVTREIISKIKGLIAQSNSPTAIRKMTGYSFTTIGLIAEDKHPLSPQLVHNVKVKFKDKEPRKRITLEILAEAEKLFSQGKTIPYVMHQCGFKRTTGERISSGTHHLQQK